MEELSVKTGVGFGREFRHKNSSRSSPPLHVVSKFDNVSSESVTNTSI